jgi:hypothetical protein
MKDKFSYFDFICYFIPGAVLIWTILLFAKGLGILNSFTTVNKFTDTLGFIIIAFILGHFVQYRAKLKLEPGIKKKYWNGVFVSKQYLIKNRNFCSEIDRQKFLKMAREKFGYTEEELQKLNTDSNEAKEISHSIYRKAYALINNEGIAERAATANTYYNFFRGLSTVSFYSAWLLILQFIIKAIESWFSWSWMTIKKDLLIPFSLGIFFFYLSECFKDRARQRGELHVEQVLNSAYTYYVGQKDP